MKATMDKAGRVVVPREIRQVLGFVPGEVDISVLGASLLMEQPGSRLREVDGHLLLPRGGPALTSDEIRELRLADQR